MVILSNFMTRETSELSLLSDIPAATTIELTDDREDTEADDLSLGG